jgi:hypothetical protein
MSIDGTDVRIPQQGHAIAGNPFSSHKFAGKCALRYEIGIDILAGNVVWFEGPYAAGKYTDLAIFRTSLIHWLDPYERVEADNGYVGEAPQQVKCPNSAANPTENLAMQNRVRSRHETLNGRLKNWEILKQPFRHNILDHGDVFRSIAIITQLSIENGEPLFQVDYND